VEISPVTMFSALRGMLRPLLVGESVNLRFIEPADIPPLYTDEAKVSQIVRNFISNALKFTERGEIRVAASYAQASGTVTFSVTDTGIGIRKEDQAAIFEEFTQLRNPLQARAKGTGLGLPLCRKLAHLLGGNVTVDSEPGAGSTFSVCIPAQFEEVVTAVDTAPPAHPVASSLKIPVLVVEDDEAAQMYYAKILRDTCYEIFPARNLREARRLLQSVRPAAIVLDIVLRGEDSWRWLGELKTGAATRTIPIIVISTVTDAGKGYLLGADACVDKPVDRAELIARLDGFTRRRILLIEDEAPMRYTMKLILEGQYVVLEAVNGKEGLRAIATLAPSLVVLDLGLPDMKGEEVLAQLRGNPATVDLPVLIATSRTLSSAESETLQLSDVVIMSKYDVNEQLLAAVKGAIASPVTAQSS
jgi:DNA-binding response OmpR family regulator/anti-sigma regulatory factor (Ser/Thr protein kinase)